MIAALRKWGELDESEMLDADAASAGSENGQNAPALLGRIIAAPAANASAHMEIC